MAYRKIHIIVFLLLVLFGATPAKARFLIFGEKVGSGTELRDYNRGLSLTTPTSLWNVSLSTKMISLTHTNEYDVYINLQESLYHSDSVEKIFISRKADLQEFLPNARFWIDKEMLNLAGTKALMLRYEDTEKERMYQEIFFILNKVCYQLSFVAKPNTFFKLESEFDAIVESLVVIEKKAKSMATSFVEDDPRDPVHSSGL